MLSLWIYLVCPSFSGTALSNSWCICLQDKEMKTPVSFVCGPGRPASWLQLPEQSNINLSEKEQREQQNPSATRLALPSISSPHLGLLSATNSPQPFIQQVFMEHLLGCQRLQKGQRQYEIKPKDHASSLLCLLLTLPKINPWEQTCSSSASCSSKEENYCRLPSLERRTVLKSPQWKSPLNTLLQEGGRKEWTGSTQTFLTFLIFCS